MEVGIDPMNLRVNGAGLTGNMTPDGYVFVNLEGTVGRVDGRQIEYVGPEPVPGLILLNGQLVVGTGDLLEKIYRAESVLASGVPFTRPMGLVGQPYFVDGRNPSREGWELFVYYILRLQADEAVLIEIPDEAESPGTPTAMAK
jgi:hypothetical protein